MDYKLSGESTIKSSELEEWQRLRVEEGGVIKFWDNVELLNDGYNLECFKEAVKLIHRNRCKTLRSRSSKIYHGGENDYRTGVFYFDLQFR